MKAEERWQLDVIEAVFLEDHLEAIVQQALDEQFALGVELLQAVVRVEARKMPGVHSRTELQLYGLVVVRLFHGRLDLVTGLAEELLGREDR